MTEISPSAGNFLSRDPRTALVIVRVDSRGNPDQLSYWKKDMALKPELHEGGYKSGALVDMLV